MYNFTLKYFKQSITFVPGPVAQSIASLVGDPGVMSWITAPYARGDWSWNFSLVILLLLIQEGLLSVSCIRMFRENWLIA